MKALSVRSGLNTNEQRKQQGLKKDNRYKKYALNHEEDQDTRAYWWDGSKPS